MLLTESASFKRFEGFFLSFVTKSTVSAGKHSSLLVLLVDSWYLWSEPTTKWVKNWVNCSGILISPSIMSSNVSPLEGRFVRVALLIIVLKMKATSLIRWSSFDFWKSASFKAFSKVILLLQMRDPPLLYFSSWIIIHSFKCNFSFSSNFPVQWFYATRFSVSRSSRIET